MAYPTFDTEGGGNVFLQCVDAAGDSHALAAVEIATANAVQHGWIGVATHVEGDAVAAPGGFTTGAAPLVLVGGDNGTNAVPLQVDANAYLKVILQTGSAAVGKLAANSGVDIGDVDVLSIIPGTAATNLGKAEDAGHTTGDVGVMALSVRQDAAAALGGTDADYQPLITDANGRLHVLDANSAAIKTAVELIDNAISGSEMQVDVVAALPAGSNAIGKLAANTGVDIGDVDVLSIVPGTAATSLGKAEDAAHSSGDTGVMSLAVRNDTLAALADTDGDYAPLQVSALGALFTVAEGGVAHDGADSGNPLKIGGKAFGGTPTAVAAGDRVDAYFDEYGRLIVAGGVDDDFLFADINDATSGDNTIIAAAGAGKRIAVWAILIVSDGTVDVRWEDGAAGTAFTGQIPLQAREGYSISAGGMVPLFKGTANTLLNLELSAAINVHGFVSYTVIDD